MQLLRFFSFFFYFSVSFYPIWMKIIWKFRKNVGLHAYRLGLVLNRSWTGLRTAIFSGLSQKFWEDRDRWSAWTGYSPVRFLVPFQSYEPDLEALLSAVVFFFYYTGIGSLLGMKDRCVSCFLSYSLPIFSLLFLNICFDHKGDSLFIQRCFPTCIGHYSHFRKFLSEARVCTSVVWNEVFII